MTESRTSRAILCVNTRSGRSRRWFFETLETLRQANIEVATVHVLLDEAHLHHALEQAKQDDIQLVLAAGGDGTIGSVVQCLVYTDFTLGVIPSGTSNDFARSLYIPMTVQGAVDVIKHGRTAKVDTGCVNGWSFCHAAILGLNTDFAQRAQRWRGLIGRASYPLASIQVYRHRKCFNVTLRSGSHERTFEAFQVAFVNAPISAGRLELHVDNLDLTDRRLRVVIIQDLSPGTVARGLLYTLTRKEMYLPGWRSFSITESTVETDDSRRVTVDGEMGPYTPLHVKVQPHSLRVLVSEQFLKKRHE